jgi:type IV pilus assembly protein PilE
LTAAPDDSRTARECSRPAQGGFTLAELLTALIALAIVVAIAIPAYRSHRLNERRSEATAALLRVQAAQERLFVQRGRYSVDLTSQPPAGLGIGDRSAHGAYRLRVELGSGGLGYRAVAEPAAQLRAATDNRCAQFSIDHNGLRSARAADGGETTRECWK